MTDHWALLCFSSDGSPDSQPLDASTGGHVPSPPEHDDDCDYGYDYEFDF